jgi:hypothetical protein
MSDIYKPQGGPGVRSTSGPPDIADQAKNLGKDLKNKASDLTETVTRAAKDHAGELQTAAKDMASDATDRVKSAMTAQKTAGADYLGTIAQAVQRSAGQFDSDVPQAAQYIRQAAGQIESVANAVRQRDMRELVGEVQEFARRQPTLFFGGAVVLGFAALRFLKSAAPTRQHGTSAGGNSMHGSSRSWPDGSSRSWPDGSSRPY